MAIPAALVILPLGVLFFFSGLVVNVIQVFWTLLLPRSVPVLLSLLLDLDFLSLPAFFKLRFVSLVHGFCSFFRFGVCVRA